MNLYVRQVIVPKHKLITIPFSLITNHINFSLFIFQTVTLFLRIRKTRKIHKWNPQTKRRLLRKLMGTPPVRSMSESKAKSNMSPISVVGGNELAQLVKMIENMQNRLDKSEKKIDLMTTTLQTLIKDTPIEATNTWKGNY